MVVLLIFLSYLDLSCLFQCYQMAAYPMYRRPRGLAIIIDIEVYENNVQESRLVLLSGTFFLN